MASRETRDGAGPARRALLAWFGAHGRSLPWRETKDPYHVWVSEVMLQQTQVATVIPYYRRFLRAFPTLQRLARAPLERVLELWSGLGYYRRARHLHQAAGVVAKDFGGHFPSTLDGARSLPGIGDYTARAILSIAFNQPYAVLDGNVARVVARLGAVKGNLHQTRFRRAVERELARLFAPGRPGDFNQALMELGQTVCLPRAPRCSRCPLRRWCRAFRRGDPEKYPLPRPRHASEARYLAAAVLRRGRKVALVRGLDEGLLGDLWNFPASFGKSEAEALLRLRRRLEEIGGAFVRFGNRLAQLRHGITFRSIHVSVFETALSQRPNTNSVRWFEMDRLKGVAADSRGAAVSRLARKIASTV